MPKSRLLIIGPFLVLWIIAVAVPLSAQEENTAQAEQEQALDDFSDIEAQIKAEEADGDTAEDSGGEDAQSPQPQEPGTPDEQLLAESEAALERMANVIALVDENATREGNSWQLTINERPILVVTDVASGRMRVMTAIASVEDLPEGALIRLMQANFDTALDARYAIAQDLVWGTFIHPLPSLTERDFISGLLQTRTLAETFGTTFSSGALSFGGGDSDAIIGEQLNNLLEELEREPNT